MKGIFKLLIAATIILMLGVICLGIAFGIAKFDFKNLSTEAPYSTYNYTCSTDVTSIVVNDRNTHISIEPGDVEHVTVEYMENDNNKYTIKENNSKLSIIKSEKENWLDLFFQFRTAQITMDIIVPKDYVGELNMHSSNAGMEIYDMNLTEADFENSNASIKAENLTISKDMRAESSNGKIELTEITTPDLSIENSNAQIALSNTTVENKLDCINSNASIIITNVTCFCIKANSSNGKIELTDVTTEQECKIDNSNASITLTNSVADTYLIKNSNNSVELVNADVKTSMDISNSNGKISGTIVGKQADFNIRSTTSNASNNLPENSTGGTKELRLDNSNASINIGFTQ